MALDNMAADPLGGLRGMLQTLTHELQQTSAELMRLKDHVVRMSDDVYGKGGIRHELDATRGALHAMSRTVRAERHRQRLAETRALADRAQRALLTRYFTTLRCAAARPHGSVATQRTLRHLHRLASTARYATAFTQWRRYATRQRTGRARVRAVRAVAGRAERGQLRGRFAVWREWTSRRCMRHVRAVTAVMTAVDDLAMLNTYTLRHRYFAQWRGYSTHRLRVAKLTVPSAEALRRTYLRRLFLHAKLRAFKRERHASATRLAAATHTGVLRRAYALWVGYPVWRRAVVRRLRQVVWCARMAVLTVVRRYFTAMARYAGARRERGLMVRCERWAVENAQCARSLDALEGRVAALVADVALMERDKLGRRELSALLAGGDVSVPGGLQLPQQLGVHHDAGPHEVSVESMPHTRSASASAGSRGAALDAAREVLAQSGAVIAHGAAPWAPPRHHSTSAASRHASASAASNACAPTIPACVSEGFLSTAHDHYHAHDPDAQWESHFAAMQRSGSGRGRMG